MTCLTLTEYLCYKWPRICSVTRNHNLVLSSFMTYHRVFDKSNATWSKKCLPFRNTRIRPWFFVISCYSIFSFICMFSKSLFVLLCFFFWPLCCLFFFDLRLLITPLVSSNSSYDHVYGYKHMFEFGRMYCTCLEIGQGTDFSCKPNLSISLINTSSIFNPWSF
jgi:hypothetical protein